MSTSPILAILPQKLIILLVKNYATAFKNQNKNSNDNHRDDPIHNMNQNKSYTGTNDRNRKNQFSKITMHNKNPKSYSFSKS